jgi:hypothetical protein
VQGFLISIKVSLVTLSSFLGMKAKDFDVIERPTSPKIQSAKPI